MKHTTTVLFAITLLFASCGGGAASSTSADPPTQDGGEFAFETSTDVDANVTVTVDGQPREFAVVQIVDALPHPGIGETIEDVISGGVHFQGATDGDGRVSASFVMPAAVQEVDIVVLESGTSGPYTVEGFRDLWGPFAPAARVTVSRAQLNDFELELWTR